MRVGYGGQDSSGDTGLAFNRVDQAGFDGGVAGATGAPGFLYRF